ncbi:LamG domain-containing protein [Candidatus Poribacteria bacterium]
MKVSVMIIIVMLVFAGSSAWAREVDKNTVLLFTFDEPFGNDVKDVSGNGNDGDVGAGIEWSNEGEIGGCAKFTGKDAIRADGSDLLKETDEGITVGFWMKKEEDVPNDASRTVVERGWGAEGGFRIYFSKAASDDPEKPDPEAPITLYWGISGVEGAADLRDYPLAPEWHYIAGTYDGKVMKLYLDGKPRGGRGGQGLIIESKQDVEIGGNFVGSIDEFRISNVARSMDDIRRHMEGKEQAVNPEQNLSTTWGAIKLR